MKAFKIKSITDVITNSSTEVFTVYDKNAIENIKQLVNAILSINNNDKKLTFDDLFDIDYNIWFGENDDVFETIINTIEEVEGNKHTDFIREHQNDDNKLKEYFKENNLYEIVIDVIDNLDDDERENVVQGLYVTPKNGIDSKNVEQAVSELNKINQIFDQYVRYC